MFVQYTFVIKASCAVYSRFKAGSDVAELPYIITCDHGIVPESVQRLGEQIGLVFLGPLQIVKGVVTVNGGSTKFTDDDRFGLDIQFGQALAQQREGTVCPAIPVAVVPAVVAVDADDVAQI